MRVRCDSLRGGGGRAPLIFPANRPLRFVQDRDGPMRIEGEITFPELGTYTVQGERVSVETLPCRC